VAKILQIITHHTIPRYVICTIPSASLFYMTNQPCFSIKARYVTFICARQRRVRACSLADASAWQLASQVESGSVSRLQVAEAAVAQLQRAEPKLHAFCTLNDNLLQEAELAGVRPCLMSMSSVLCQAKMIQTIHWLAVTHLSDTPMSTLVL
jgi:hypothetical protein